MNPRTLRKKILLWYDLHGRDLPWRRTRDPYRVFVSEIMLQQTQVERVLALYPRWLKTFPGFRSLALAARREAIVAWSGMGYNRRALYLKRTAEIVMERFGGRLPRDPALLRTLPGVGEYTAAAVACFAFGSRVPVIDVNVRRVIGRIVGVGARGIGAGNTIAAPRTLAGARRAEPLSVIAGLLFPRKRFYDWNQALMDLGALLCTARRPRCPACPARAECASRGFFDRPIPARNMRAGKAEIPRRIYRGRVVELLRRIPAGASAAQIGTSIFPEYGAAERKRLDGILQSLEKEGLIRAMPQDRSARRRGAGEGIRYALAD